MRRIARVLAGPALALALAGCGGGERRTEEMRALPPPILSTRPPSARSRTLPLPPPTAEPLTARLDKSGWIPPGGIKDRWRAIVVHHSTSAKDTPRSMDEYHRRVRGWENGLGYHFVIGNGVGYPDGAVFVGDRWKRQIQGAHCGTKSPGKFFGSWYPSNYFNDHGIGICLIGNFNDSRPTAGQMAALRELCAFLSEQTGIPLSRVYGHGHITHRTECPGRNLSLTTLRQSLSPVFAGSR